MCWDIGVFLIVGLSLFLAEASAALEAELVEFLCALCCVALNILNGGESPECAVGCACITHQLCGYHSGNHVNDYLGRIDAGVCVIGIQVVQDFGDRVGNDIGEHFWKGKGLSGKAWKGKGLSGKAWKGRSA